MTEAEARELLREVNRTSPWVGRLDPARHGWPWWVKAHHPAMRQVAAGRGKLFPCEVLDGREAWLAALARWGSDVNPR